METVCQTSQDVYVRHSQSMTITITVHTLASLDIGKHSTRHIGACDITKSLVKVHLYASSRMDLTSTWTSSTSHVCGVCTNDCFLGDSTLKEDLVYMLAYFSYIYFCLRWPMLTILCPSYNFHSRLVYTCRPYVSQLISIPG